MIAVALVCLNASARRSEAEAVNPARVGALSFARGTQAVLFDATSGAPLRAVQIGGGATGLAVAADGGRLFVTGHGRLDALDLHGDGTNQRLKLYDAEHVVAAVDPERAFLSRAAPHAVVAVRFAAGGGTVAVPTVSWSTTVPGRVSALALAPAGDLLFAAYGRRPSRIAVLDAANGALLRSFVGGRTPVALAPADDGLDLFAVSSEEGTLTAIRVADGSRSTPIRVGTHSGALAVAPDDAAIYALNPGARLLLRVDRTHWVVDRTLALPGRPYDLAETPDGSRIVVTSPRAKAVYLIDPTTFQIVQTVPFPNRPQRIVFAPAASAVSTPTPTATAESVATETMAATPTETATPTSTVTATNTETAPPPPTPASTSTPVDTPIPLGVVLGAVFDDGSAQPLPGVSIRMRGATDIVQSSDAGGRYVLTVLAGERAIELATSGFTRSVRRVTVAPGAANRLLDARLTALAPFVRIGDDGGTVRSASETSVAASDVELVIPSGLLPNATDIRLTPLSPQGLIAPVPLGWSVLLGVDLAPALPSATARAPATVRVPLALLGPAAAGPVTVALWDDDSLQWRAGPPVTVSGSTLDISLDPIAAGMSGSISQIAVVVADTLPLAPPPAAPGAPLVGVALPPSSAESAVVSSTPPYVLAGAHTRAWLRTQVHSAAPLVSGTALHAVLEETYALRTGQHVVGTTSTQNFIGYQLSPAAPGEAVVEAVFRFVPSRSFAIAELIEGRVIVTVHQASAPEHASLVDPSGGEASGSGGLRLLVPPNAVNQTTVIALRPRLPDSLPITAGNLADLVGAFEMDVTGGIADAAAAFEVALGAGVAEGQRFIIGRLTATDDGPALSVVAFGHAANGRVVFDTCPAEVGTCLDGLRGSGTYAVFIMPAAAAVVTGTVADDTGGRAGIAVRSDAIAVVSVSDGQGRYILPAPVGVTSTLSARDRGRDLAASASVEPAVAGEVLTADLLLQTTVPHVVQVTPANHAAYAAVSTAIAVTFSEPVAPGSLNDASVHLEQVSNTGASLTAAHRSLSADATQLLLTPTAPLAANSVYRLRLSGQITDRAGTRLIPFSSDFTTAPVFKADALPPNTLRVSLPDGEGRVFVCGGAQLAAPGTAVRIINAANGLTLTGRATARDGLSGSDVCDSRFPGRCDTGQPGGFCAVIDAALGDRIQVEVEDVLHDAVSLEAGNMRDERTGATVIGAAGGRVTSAEDARYAADVPPDAFDAVRLVTIFPVRDEEFPVRLNEVSGLRRVGAVLLDFGDDDAVAAKEIDLTIPAPPDLDPDAQVLVGHVVNFRGVPELTLVDTASLGRDANGEATLSADSPPFPGPTRSGHYDFSTPDRAVGYVVGVVDKQHGSAEVIPTAITFVFPFVAPVLTKFVLPVVASQPFSVSLYDTTGRVIDQIDIEGPPRGQFIDLPRSLTDDDAPVTVDGFSIPAGNQEVASDAPIVLTFSKPVDTDREGRVADGVIRVRDQNGKLIAGTWSIVSADGRQVRFFPRRPLPPASTIEVGVLAVRDRGGKLFPAYATTFSTFTPQVVASVPIAANDVDVLQRVEGGTVRPYAIVARDGDPTNDDAGGIVAVDLRNARAPHVAGEVLTPGVDRAVRVASHDPPLVLSVDGAGHPQRFGTLRAFDFADPSNPVEVGRRVLNLSPQVISEHFFLSDVPPDGGVPESLALLGSAVYIANPPVIGVEGVTLARMIPPRNEIEGIFRGGYRAVAALRHFVVAAGQGLGSNELVTLDPTLSLVQNRRPLAAPPLALVAVPSYPMDFDGDGNLGVAEDVDGDPGTAAGEVEDLVVVLGAGHELRIFSLTIDGQIAREASMTLPQGLGNQRGADVDPRQRILYVASGTAGLALVDFNDPFSSSPDPNPVLVTVALAGQARKVRLVRDARGIEYALVATDRALDVVQITPDDAGLIIYDTNNVSVIPERFEESVGTFVLANNDNDDADADADGRPIVDRDDAERVQGENDLRRLDIVVPMTQGRLTLDMPEGAAQARLWLTADRDGAFVLPQEYDLSSGERPPETVWIEGVAPSDADHDVRVTMHWEPPSGSGLEPFDDAVTATVIELDFVPGRHGAGEPSANYLGDRKTTFVSTDAEDLEQVLNGEIEPGTLGQGRFGGVRVRGVDAGSLVAVTVRVTDEGLSRGAAAPVNDETATNDLTLQELAARTVISIDDVMVYSGVAQADDGGVAEPAVIRNGLRSAGLLPVQAKEARLANAAVQVAVTIQSAVGMHPPLVAGDAGLAALEVIDAQAFARQISDGVRGGALVQHYLSFDGAAGSQFVGMDGALADRWSRLVLRLTLPALDPHTSFDFTLDADPPEARQSLGSNHIGDELFPIGMLSRSGFDGFAGDESAPEQVTASGPAVELRGVPVQRSVHRRAAVAVYTPPGSFPYRTSGTSSLFERLKVSVGATSDPETWAAHTLMLVRSPVMFVHGLIGDRQAFGQAFVDSFFGSFVSFFVDYGRDSLSGFDRIFSAVPREIGAELARLRLGDHESDDDSRMFDRGQSVKDLRHKHIAATKVDAIAHSMGGLATRWYVTDGLAAALPRPRMIQYPASSGLPSVAGTGFPPIQTQRADSYRYKRPDNFMRGDLRKIVTTASPQLGSPLGNYVTHEVCDDDRSCYTNPLTADTLFYWLQQINFVPEGASQSADVGTAVYDLSIGSAAIELLQETPSEPVPVHAIVATKWDATGVAESILLELLLRSAATLERALHLGLLTKWIVSELGLAQFLYPAPFAATPNSGLYCPGFGASTSDLVVPTASARYGTQHYTPMDPFNHLEVNQAEEIGKRISKGLLFDDLVSLRVNDFDDRFPLGQPSPLSCQGG